MKARTIRKLESLERLRRTVVAEALTGMRRRDVARRHGVSEGTVYKWLSWHRQKGDAGLASRRRGRPRGTGSRLSAQQRADLCEAIVRTRPDELGLDDTLWTRQSVTELIHTAYGFTPSASTVYRLLHEWGFTPPDVRKRYVGRNLFRFNAWFNDQYDLMLVRCARAVGYRITWLCAHHIDNGQGDRLTVVTFATNRGNFAFEVVSGRSGVKEIGDIIRRFARHAIQKVYLVIGIKSFAESELNSPLFWHSLRSRIPARCEVFGKPKPVYPASYYRKFHRACRRQQTRPSLAEVRRVTRTVTDLLAEQRKQRQTEGASDRQPKLPVNGLRPDLAAKANRLLHLALLEAGLESPSDRRELTTP